MRFLLALTDLPRAVFASTPNNGIPRYEGHSSDLRKAIRAKKRSARGTIARADRLLFGQVLTPPNIRRNAGQALGVALAEGEAAGSAAFL
jgi:hypothetical protein